MEMDVKSGVLETFCSRGLEASTHYGTEYVSLTSALSKVGTPVLRDPVTARPG